MLSAAAPLMLWLLLLFAATVCVVESRPRWRSARGAHGTRASLLVGYQVCTVAGNLYLAVAGCAWFGAEVPATAADRLYSDLPYVRKHVLAPLVAHLASDLLLYLSLPELRQPALIAHHLLTGALAQLATHPVPYTHHYILFFAGAAELSNLPLGWIELCKLLPPVRAASPGGYSAARAVFAASFVTLRLLLWPAVTVRFWSDSLLALRGDVACASRGATSFYLASNAVLTAMQLGWGVIICRRIAAAASAAASAAPSLEHRTAQLRKLEASRPASSSPTAPRALPTRPRVRSTPLACPACPPPSAPPSCAAAAGSRRRCCCRAASLS